MWPRQHKMVQYGKCSLCQMWPKSHELGLKHVTVSIVWASFRPNVTTQLANMSQGSQSHPESALSVKS